MKPITNESFTPSQYPLAVQKMKDFDAGTRKENIKACGDQKLVDYYDICVSHNFNNAKYQLEQELRARGLGTFANQQTSSTLTPADIENKAAKTIINKLKIADLDWSAEYYARIASGPKSLLNKDVDLSADSYNVFIRPDMAEQMLRLLLMAMILELDEKVAIILKQLTNDRDDIKAIVRQRISEILNNPALKVVLMDARNSVIKEKENASSTEEKADAAQSSTTTVPNMPEIIVEHGIDLQGKFFRLVVYNKDYAPPARQYFLVRGVTTGISSLRNVGIEGSPRATPATAEPVFDSVAQAVNFSRMTGTLNTKRNIANFKIVVTDRPLSGRDDLTGCKLVDTICGPAYIQPNSQYFNESVDKPLKENSTTTPQVAVITFNDDDSEWERNVYIIPDGSTEDDIVDALYDAGYSYVDVEEVRDATPDELSAKPMSITDPVKVIGVSEDEANEWNAEVFNESLSKNLLKESIEKHETLNPKLFDENNKLLPEVREKLLEIAKEFTDKINEDNVAFNIQEIKIVGSNCSYNYTDKSDIDMHIQVETASLEDNNNLYPIIYDLYRSLWSKKYSPTIKGIPVELFVETEASTQLDDAAAELAEKIRT